MSTSSSSAGRAAGSSAPAGTSYVGERLGLPAEGPGAVASWGRRILALSVDWERATPSGRVVRRSEIVRRELPDGLHVAYSTITDLVGPDGTIARLPATFRLWYPSHDGVDAMLDAAGLTAELRWGSYDLEPFDPIDSERWIIVAQRR